MTKVYVVTSGEYSDYKIEGVFSNSDKAKEFADFIEEEPARVEEYELDIPREEWCIYQVYMKQDGTVRMVMQILPRTRSLICPEHRPTPGFWGYTLDAEALIWRVKTNDREQAIKVVGEKRAIILANNLWGDEEKTRKLFE